MARGRFSFYAVGFSLWAVALGASAATPSLNVPRVQNPPRMSDVLEHLQPPGVLVGDFRQYDPNDGAPASQKTLAYVSYDHRSLHVVFICYDDPRLVRARLSKRDNIGDDDGVAVLLDTFHDRRRAYVFQVNPLGVQADLIVTEGQPDDYSFDTLWYSEGRLTSFGYVVRIEIPFRSLRFSNEPVQHWGIALARVIVRNNELDYWPYITRRVAGLVQQFADMDGLEAIHPGRNLQFIPYGLYARARFLDPAVPAFRTADDRRGGLDGKWVLHDALTFDFTLNPDFSQVESDDPQVTINQRFEVFFPEKRPFFIENNGFFQTSAGAGNLFFSRRIVDPQFGLRVSGKLGHWAIGGLLSDDRAEGELLPPASPYFHDRAAIQVARIQREFGEQSAVGVFVSNRSFGPSFNRVFALDTRLRLNANWVVEARAETSQTRDLDGTRSAGPAYELTLTRAGQHLVYGGGYVDRSPNFRSDLGFVPRVDVRYTSHFLQYLWRPRHGAVVAFGPGVSTLVNWDHEGHLEDWLVGPTFQVTLRRQTVLQVSRTERYELFEGLGFRQHLSGANVQTQWLSWLGATAAVSWGTAVNYFPAAGLLPFLATSQNASLSLTVRPTPRLRVDETYFYTRLGTRAGSTPVHQIPGISIFNNHVLRNKVNYQFTKALSLRAIVDYNATLPNPDLVDVQTTLGGVPGGPLVPTRKLTADFLLTYLVHPGTALYVGYTDGYQNLAIAPGGILVYRRAPTTSTGRQVFVKLSYLFRF